MLGELENRWNALRAMQLEALEQGFRGLASFSCVCVGGGGRGEGGKGGGREEGVEEGGGGGRGGFSAFT